MGLIYAIFHLVCWVAFICMIPTIVGLVFYAGNSIYEENKDKDIFK
jgi:hypothetical protein